MLGPMAADDLVGSQLRIDSKIPQTDLLCQLRNTMMFIISKHQNGTERERKENGLIGEAVEAVEVG